MNQHQQDLLERLVAAIEADVRQRLEDRTRQQAAAKREATAMSAILLGLFSLVWLDVALSDPFFKLLSHNWQALPVALSAIGLFAALLYRAFRMEVIPLSTVVASALYAGGLAALFGLAQSKISLIRIASILFGLYVLAVFFRDYLPENENMRRRLDRLAGWLTGHKRIGPAVAIGLLLLPVGLLVYAAGLTMFALSATPIVAILLWVLVDKFVWQRIRGRHVKR